MGLKGKKTPNKFEAMPPFPMQPWIYICDPTDNDSHVSELKTQIDACQFNYTNDEFYGGSAISATDTLLTSLDKFKEGSVTSKSAFLIVDQLNRLDCETRGKVEAATKIRQHAAKSGRTFASVNLFLKDGTKNSELKKWGPNHLELEVTDLTTKQVADKVYKWLFEAIPPAEHIYLLTQAKLEVADKKTYPEYEYCSIREIKNRPKDAKLQFGVVITTTPVVTPGTQILRWTVADKTGTGNFYFQYRGASSQYTWDWVIGLKAGDICSLPRMPSMLVKEPRRVRIAKLPLRTVSFGVSTLGLAIKGVGMGLVKVGDVMSMGRGSEWVPRDDLDKTSGKKVNWAKKWTDEARARKEKVEKAEKEILKAMTAKKQPCDSNSNNKKKNDVLDEKKDAADSLFSDNSTVRASDDYENEKTAAMVSEKEFC